LAVVKLASADQNAAPIETAVGIRGSLENQHEVIAMAKGQDKKKEPKKKPTKTLMEKRAEKRAKREGRK
jgi:hypothetical protein